MTNPRLRRFASGFVLVTAACGATRADPAPGAPGAPGAPANGDAAPGDLDATVRGNDAGTLDHPPLDPLDTSPFSSPGADASIVAFDKALVCFGSGGAGPCSRTLDRQVAFPATGAFSKVVMRLTLTCPSNGCDPWDRFGSIYKVEPPTSAGGPETLVELGRFMTPYGIRAGVNAPPVWEVDVTALRPLLAGNATLRVFIDTWSPQGNAAQNGGGWLFGASFEMTGGRPAKTPVVVLPIATWTSAGKEPTQIVYGDPRSPIQGSLPPRTLDLPAGPTSWSVRSIITGHGQANLDNCAEFCPRTHTWKVGTTENTKTVWRTDCASFPSSGTYRYPRAGWCPGAQVLPWDFDVTSQVESGRPSTFAYDVEAYVNTCNGDAPGGGLCTGCPSGASCAYNGGSHTPPFYYVSSVLIGYR